LSDGQGIYYIQPTPATNILPSVDLGNESKKAEVFHLSKQISEFYTQNSSSVLLKEFEVIFFFHCIENEEIL
jgi:hypothetical protein